jgi:hypothetical protein
LPHIPPYVYAPIISVPHSVPNVFLGMPSYHARDSITWLIPNLVAIKYALHRRI